VTGADPGPERMERLERLLAARDKTIAVLIQRQLDSRAQGTTALNTLEQNISLERVVARKTQELAKERADLENALGQLKLTQTRLLQAQGRGHPFGHPAHGAPAASQRCHMARYAASTARV